MEPKHAHLEQLLSKFLAGNLTEEEWKDFIAFIKIDEYEGFIKSRIRNQFDQETAQTVEQELLVSLITESIDRSIFKLTDPQLKHGQDSQITTPLEPDFKAIVREDSIPNRRLRASVKSTRTAPKFRWYKIAALGFLLSAISFLMYDKFQDASLSSTQEMAQDIQPGGNRAILRFETGEEISLDEKNAGITIQDDAIVYDDGRVVKRDFESENLVFETPNAGQYRLTLPDGTQVWLNAASKITFHGDAQQQSRLVTLEGEASFDVTHDPNRPFVVKSAKHSVHVLGTKFNVQAYGNEAVHQTTLLEGSITIDVIGQTQESYLLEPNQQLQIGKGNAQLMTVDAEEYFAWLRGLILLHNYNLGEVSRVLERWYDVEFETIPEGISNKRVFGSLQKDLPLRDVLLGLEKNYGIKFRVEERRVRIVAD